MPTPIVVDRPVRKHAGRPSRLNTAFIEGAVTAIREGKCVSDNEPVKSRSTAYQRGGSCRDKVQEVLGTDYALENHAVASEDGNGFLWVVGPKESNETPRPRSRKRAAETPVPDETSA